MQQQVTTDRQQGSAMTNDLKQKRQQIADNGERGERGVRSGRSSNWSNNDLCIPGKYMQDIQISDEIVA